MENTKNYLYMCYRLYTRAIFKSLSFFFRLTIKQRKISPMELGSVLHVSFLSHKPYMLSRWLRKAGIKSDYLAIVSEGEWLKANDPGYDYNIRLSRMTLLLRPWVASYYVWRVMSRYDVIHIHFSSLLTDDGREILYLKKMGKIIVFHFRGCDLREKTKNNRLNPDLNCCQECDYPTGCCENDRQRQRISLAKQYADLLFVTTPDLLDFMPEAEHIPFVAPDEKDLARIAPAKRDFDIFRVVTSSNHDSIDGTVYIRKAVSRLADEGESIELVEVKKTPYQEALAIYKSADIYIGKLRMGYYNNANIETLMMGVPNMCYIRGKFLEKIPDCPIIITRPESVYETLKSYLHQREKLREIGKKGPGFVKKYHDPVKVSQMMIKRYKSIIKQRTSCDVINAYRKDVGGK